MNKFSNFFKVVAILDMDLLIEKLLDSALNIYVYSKQNGCFKLIVNNVDVYRDILNLPINNDEWFAFLNSQFVGPQELFNNIMSRITLLAISKKDYIQSKENLTLDIVGAFVGETSAILGNNFYTPFIDDILNKEKILESDQNLIVTSTAHLLNRLSIIDSPKNIIMNFLTPELINKLMTLASNNVFPPRIIIQFEMCIKQFINKHIPINNLDKLGQMI